MKKKDHFKRLKKCISLLCVFAICMLCIPVYAEEEEPQLLTRADAAIMLDEMFALADVYPLAVPEYETTAKDMGYTATNGAIATENVIAAAKDCVTYETQPQIEAVINAGLMDLDTDGLSFRPSNTVTKYDFALSIAKGLYGVDLDIDYLAYAMEDGIFTESQLTDEEITVDEAQAIVDEISNNLQIVSIFVTSDIHGNYIPYTSSDSNFEIGSVARIKTILDETRSELGEENVLYLDGGDSPYNTTLANTTMGDVSVAALNMLGLNATVLGNHDYDYSFENLLRLATDADYAMLSANTKYKDGHEPEGSDSLYPEELGDYITYEIAGIKVGIFGVTDDTSAATTLYSNTADITWDTDLDKADEVVATLRDEENCDMIIALSHLHTKNDDLVLAEPDIALSIGGGNDFAGRPTILGENQYLVNPGKHCEALTQINICLYDGSWTGGFVYNQLYLTNAYEEDADVKALIDDYNEQVDVALDQTIGYLGTSLEWSSELVRCQNSPIANLVTDALLAYFEEDGAELCIVNGGGIRAAMQEGEISTRDVTSVLPFDNNMMLVETSGQTIFDAIQNGISSYPETNGKFPQVAGMTYAFDGETNTLLSVTLDDGTPLDLDATYKVVINSFLAGGGDGYTMFNVLDDSIEMATDVTELVYPNMTYMRDALATYFETHSSEDNPITVDLTENRITIE